MMADVTAEGLCKQAEILIEGSSCLEPHQVVEIDCECDFFECSRVVKVPKDWYKRVNALGYMIRHNDCATIPEEFEYPIFGGESYGYQVWLDIRKLKPKP
jgi:hypothetical protein